MTVTTYAPAVNPDISSVVAPLSQEKLYVEVPETVKLIEPSFPPKQVTSTWLFVKVGGVQVAEHAVREPVPVTDIKLPLPSIT